MQLVSLLWGIAAIAGFLVAFTPCLGSLNWVNIPFSAVGLVVSLVTLVKTPPDKARSGAIAGVVCCSVAVILGIVRLVIGGGVL